MAGRLRLCSQQGTLLLFIATSRTALRPTPLIYIWTSWDFQGGILPERQAVNSFRSFTSSYLTVALIVWRYGIPRSVPFFLLIFVQYLLHVFSILWPSKIISQSLHCIDSFRAKQHFMKQCVYSWSIFMHDSAHLPYCPISRMFPRQIMIGLVQLTKKYLTFCNSKGSLPCLNNCVTVP
jgi:hypothetical protein